MRRNRCSKSLVTGLLLFYSLGVSHAQTIAPTFMNATNSSEAVTYTIPVTVSTFVANANSIMSSLPNVLDFNGAGNGTCLWSGSASLFDCGARMQVKASGNNTCAPCTFVESFTVQSSTRCSTHHGFWEIAQMS